MRPKRRTTNKPMSRQNYILIAEPGQKRERYLKALSDFDVAVDCVDLPGDVFEKCCSKEYSGLLLDFVTMMKSRGSKKLQVEELASRLPSIRLHVDPKRNCLVGLLYGQTVPGDGVLRVFVEKCSKFNASKIRLSERIEKIFSVLLFQDSDVSKHKDLLANTTNISCDGAFITTLHPISKKGSIWAQIQEFEDNAPICCEVRWVQPWGVEDRLPGVGVLFMEPTQQQQKELEYYVSRALGGLT